jgi:hypothetical protein
MKLSLQTVRYSIILALRPSLYHFLPSVSDFYQARTQTAKSDYQLRQVFLSVRINNSAHTRQFFLKYDKYFGKSVEKIRFTKI